MSETYQTLNIPIEEMLEGDKVRLLSINYVAMENARLASGYSDVVVVKLQAPCISRKGAYFIHSYPVGTHIDIERAVETPVNIRVDKPVEMAKKLCQVSQDLARQGGVWDQHRDIVNDLIHSIMDGTAVKEESPSVFEDDSTFTTVSHLKQGDRIRLNDDSIMLVTSTPTRPLYSSQWCLDLTYETTPHMGKSIRKFVSEHEVFIRVKKLPKLESKIIDVRRVRPEDHVQFEDGRVYRVIGIRSDYLLGWSMIRCSEVSPTTLKPYPYVKPIDVTRGFKEMVTKWEFSS